MEKLLLNSIRQFDVIKRYNKVIDSDKTANVSGLFNSSLSTVIYNTFERINKSLLVVVEDAKTAKDMVDDLDTFTDQARYFPAKDIVFFESYAHSNEIIFERLKIIEEIFKQEQIIIVTTIENLLMKMAPKHYWYNLFKEITMDDTIDLDKFKTTLIDLGYERTDMVESKSHFSIRGGIIDIFPPSEDVPYRIELFGDEIDSIREFDVSDQRSIQKVESFKFGPCREIILNNDIRERFVKKIKDDLDHSKLTEEAEENIIEHIDHMEQGLYIDGLEKYFPYLYDDFDTLLDYLDEYLLTMVEPNRVNESAHFFVKDVKARFTNYFEKNKLLPQQIDLSISPEEVNRSIESIQKIFFNNLQKKIKGFGVDTLINFNAMEPPKYFNKIHELARDIETWKTKGYKILIAINNKNKIQSLSNTLQEFNIFPKTNSDTIKAKEVVIYESLLKEGFVLKTCNLVVLTENELFGVKKYKKRKLHDDKSKIIKSFDELDEGDLVVHEKHGIGKFIGVTKLEIEKNTNDYLQIKYSGSDFLYIPVNQMDLIQKYIGKKKETMRLSSLNNDQWLKKKIKAKKAIEDMTEDLLELYSKRVKTKGYNFSEDTQWQREFEELFPYQETEDQLKCVEEIKEDMEKEVPMERLLCGDVGYGKTEVAVRAMFKAVDNNKQVAFLVPTTILAQQHFNTLKDRFERYPITIEMISRFRTKKQQREIIKKSKKGLVDILIGTHRLLSDDVGFKDLGLLVVDEEQRFGVKDKEKIKFMKETIDILTLTATPIPRTLHMSLIGIRDMSIIEDPPENRYPVQTYVTEFDENLIRESILREVGRNGQVYFVHNRVKDIDNFTEKIRKILPKLTIEFAHGQMSERKLEKIMMQFINNEFDVLISTTIIETGLDLPNVNTILINDADRFGLSQLYQLRGRVGRSNKIAYAYLLYRKNKVLSEVAEKRLKAIKNFTELGAGFKIAMRDLEIRGAGNILGAKQHGHMEAIGYELYTKLLSETIDEVKGNTVKEKIDAKISINIDAYIPDGYIQNSKYKLEMYKKVSTIETIEDLYEMQDEFYDRFGDIPMEVFNLINISHMKAMIEDMRISEMIEKNNFIEFKYKDKEDIDLEIMSKILKEYKRKLKLKHDEPRFIYRFRNRTIDDQQKVTEILKFVKRVYKLYKE